MHARNLGTGVPQVYLYLHVHVHASIRSRYPTARPWGAGAVRLREERRGDSACELWPRGIVLSMLPSNSSASSSPIADSGRAEAGFIADGFYLRNAKFGAQFGLPWREMRNEIWVRLLRKRA